MEIPNNENPMALEMNRPAPGTMVVYGNNGKRVECFNLNEKTNCTRLFEKCENITFPEGVDFAGCKTGEYMFSSAKNIEFKNAEVFENITNANYMFATSNSIKGISKFSFKNATNAELSFASAALTEDLLEATFENVTNANQLFNNMRKVGGTMINMPKSTFERVTTGFGNVFWDLVSQADKRVNLPQATFASQRTGGNSYRLTGVKFNMPKLTWERLTTSYNKKS